MWGRSCSKPSTRGYLLQQCVQCSQTQCVLVLRGPFYLCSILGDVFTKQKLNVRVTAIVNDTVGTLMARAAEDRECLIVRVPYRRVPVALSLPSLIPLPYPPKIALELLVYCSTPPLLAGG